MFAKAAEVFPVASNSRALAVMLLLAAAIAIRILPPPIAIRASLPSPSVVTLSAAKSCPIAIRRTPWPAHGPDSVLLYAEDEAGLKLGHAAVEVCGRLRRRLRGRATRSRVRVRAPGSTSSA